MLALALLIQAVPDADVSWAEPRELAAAELALGKWYHCMRTQIPLFAKKRSLTVDEATTAVMTQCAQQESAVEEANIAVLDSSAHIGPAQAREMGEDMSRKGAAKTRAWVFGEIAKTRP